MTERIHTEKLFARVLELVEAGRTDEATQRIIEFVNPDGIQNLRQIEILNILVRDLVVRLNRMQHHSSLQPDLAGDKGVSPPSAARLRDLLGILTRAHDRALVLVGDLTRTLNLVLTRAHNVADQARPAYDLAGDLDYPADRIRIRDLAVDLARACDLARNVDSHLAHDLECLLGCNKVLGDVLSEIAAPINELHPSVVRENKWLTEEVIQFTLHGVDRLSVQSLSAEVLPYLQAVVALQAVIARLKGRSPVVPQVLKLTQEPVVEAVIDGAVDAITMIGELIQPWRRRHIRQAIEYEAGVASEPPASKAYVDYEFSQAKVDLARTILKTVHPVPMNETDQVVALAQLLEVVGTLIGPQLSRLTIEVQSR